MEKFVTAAKCLAVLGALAFLTSCTPPIPRPLPPLARQGIMDLRTWDFTRDGVVPLNGQWSFAWGAPETPSAEPAGDTHWLVIPGIWNTYRHRGRPVGPDGIAVYRLTILLPESTPRLAFTLKEINTAYELSVNGVTLSGSGTVGTDAATAVPLWRPHMAAFDPPGRSLALRIVVSNYHYINGGIQSPILLGTEAEGAADRERTTALSLFTLGSILIMGLYHLGLYVIRRRDPAPLYFGLFCCVMALRILVSGEYFISIILPGIPWWFSQKLEYLSFCASVPLFATFIYELYRTEFHRRVIRLVQAVGGAFVLLVIVTPSKINSHTAPAYQILTIAAMAYVLGVLILSFKRRREGAGILLAGCAALFAMVANDILFENRIIYTSYMSHYGLFIFIFSQAFLLLFRFSSAYTRVESMGVELDMKTIELERKTLGLMDTNMLKDDALAALRRSNDELEELKRALEDKVHERTNDLEKALHDLSVANKSLRNLAIHDSLTGVRNRRNFDEVLAKEWRRAHRHHHTLSLLMIDLDHFKDVNDNYGHMTGDECLRHISRVITAAMKRPADVAARFGGEEFAVILPNTPAAGARAFAESIRRQVAESPIETGGITVSFTVSIGVSTMVPMTAEGQGRLLALADNALYESKNNGRNQVRYCGDGTEPTQPGGDEPQAFSIDKEDLQ